MPRRRPDGDGTMSGLSVLLVDDHAAVRAGMRMILESAGIAVAGEAADGTRGVAMARTLRPDAVLMDVRMPEMDGIEATSRIVAAGWAPVLVLTTFELDEYLFGALRAGAAGYVLKSAEAEELVRAVREVTSGRGAIDPAVTLKLIGMFAGTSNKPGPALDSTRDEHTGGSDALIAQLSDRERAVLEALGGGLSNRLIARQLGIAETTVKTHVSNVLIKLGLRSRVQAAIYWAERGR